MTSAILQPAVVLVFAAIEAQAEPADAAVRRRGRRRRRRGDAHVRRVQLADHQVQQAAHLVRRLRAGDARCVLRAHGVPVDAVELVVVEAVAHVGPRLLEDLHLLLREVDVHLRRHRDRPRLARLDGMTVMRPCSR